MELHPIITESVQARRRMMFLIFSRTLWDLSDISSDIAKLPSNMNV